MAARASKTEASAVASQPATIKNTSGDIDRSRIRSRGLPESLSTDITDKFEAINEVQRNGRRLKHVSKELKRDKEVVLPAVSKDGFALEYAARELRGDPEIVLAALQNKGVRVLRHATEELRDNRHFLESLVGEYGVHGQLLQFASNRLKGNKEFIKFLVSKGCCTLQYVSRELRGDPEYVLAALQSTGMGSLNYETIKLMMTLEHDTLRGNAEIIMSAVSNYGCRILAYAASNLRDDEVFFRTLLEIGSSGEILRYASARLKSQKDLIIQAISLESTDQPLARANPPPMLCSFMYASETLKNDREVVMKALEVDGMSLQYASESMKADQEVIRFAVWSGGIEVLKYASHLIKDNRCFLESLVDEYGAHGQLLQFASDRLKGNKKLVLSAVSKDGMSLLHAAENLKSDRDVARAAVLQDWKALTYVSETLRDDKELFMAAVKQHPQLLIQASAVTTDDPESVLTAVTGDVTLLEYASDPIKRSKDFAMKVVTIHGIALRYLANEVKDDKDVVLAALNTSGVSIQYASERLQHDKDVVLAALRQDGNLLESVPECFRFDKECVLTAISSQPGALRFALGWLNQDPKCLIAAGLWDAKHGRDRPKKRIILSTRFSLAAGSSPTATEFTNLLKKHPYFGDALYAFQVYSPNAFNKHSCDPNWTDMEWKCRGTKETCRMKDRSLCEGPPRTACCWRYSYRCHLAEAKASRGFMIQVVEVDRTNSRWGHETGKGQAIESVMAGQVGTKVFVVHEPCHTFYDGANWPSPFQNDDIDRLAHHVEEWYGNGCEDMRTCCIGSRTRFVIQDVLRQDGSLLESLPEYIRSDKECVLKNDRDAKIVVKRNVMAALRQDGNLLGRLPECFRGDKDCVLAAVSSQPGALRFALGDPPRRLPRSARAALRSIHFVPRNIDSYWMKDVSTFEGKGTSDREHHR